ncbi:MAG: DUF3263 domain-containing protein [Actinomycetota bacterium]|nr:DUF3263 domain-containing protein [Actinomycetota bacterium]
MDSTATPGATGLTDREQAVLAFERDWCRRQGPATKADAIRLELSMSRARYYALLDRLVDAPAALAHDPLLVRRLRRQRTDRRRARFTGVPTRRRQGR